MRIGFDVDGVLANFAKGYQELIVELTGEDKFPAETWKNPPCWNWDAFYGYTKEQSSMVWEEIKANPSFWFDLEPFGEAIERVKNVSNYSHDVYFITDRPGQGAHCLTEAWLAKQLGAEASVIISRKGKGICCQALDLELYLDDKVENILDVQEKSPSTIAILVPATAYNTNHDLRNQVKFSANTVADALGDIH